MIMRLKKQAFTLVELVVVVTVLSILATIGFVSFSSYLEGSRDSNRIANLASIGDGINTSRVMGKLPLPEDSVKVYAGVEHISTQGYVSQNILDRIGYYGEGFDPLDGKYYTYYLLKNRKQFQLMGFLEKEESIEYLSLLGEQAQAEDTSYDERYPFFYGSKLGVLTDKDGAPIQENEELSESGSLDVYTTEEEFTIHLDEDDSASGTGSTIYAVETLAETGGQLCDVDGNLVECEQEDGLCVARPDYPNAVFTPGSPTVVDTPWQNTDFTQDCFYQCKQGFGGLDCNTVLVPQDGVCGTDHSGSFSATPTQLCDAGNASSVTDNGAGATYTWSCNGIYGGTTTNCFANHLAPIPGVCGSDNGGDFYLEPTQLCDAGTASSVADNGTGSTYDWTCAGLHFGVDASCSANHVVTVNGSCTNLPSNALYEDDTTSYSLIFAPDGTPLDATLAGYNATPTVNRCEFKCEAGYHNEGGSTCILDTRICFVDNGTGLETWNGSSWGVCTVTTCNTDYYQTSTSTCGAVGDGYYSPDTVLTRTACSNSPADNASRDYSYNGSGGGTNNCSYIYADLCGGGEYETVSGTCSTVTTGTYSPAGDNNSYSCTNHPDTASRNYTYTSSGGATNSCSATYTDLCGVDKYETSNGVCSNVGTGRYSPSNNNTRYSCTGKPSNTVYTSDGNGSNNCSYGCITDYYLSSGSCVPVGNGYYSTSGSDTRIACTNHPDTASRDYTYTSDGNGSNSCSATYTDLCTTDRYETSNGVCSSVGNGYYSPANNNTRYSCTGKPSNSVWTSDGNGSNNCSYGCSTDYYKVSTSCNAVGNGYYSPNGNDTRYSCTNMPADNASRDYTVYTSDGNGSNNCSYAYNEDCGVDVYETSVGTCSAVGTGYYSPDNENSRTACSNYPDNTSRDYTYSSDGNGSNNCSATYTDKCDTDLYEQTEGSCSAVGTGYYSGINDNTRYTCTNHPDTASRNYTYTSDGNGSNNCNASYSELCGVDLYETTNGTCSAVGTGYYSPSNENSRTSCSNKPSNSSYTGDGNGSNNCTWSCNTNYTWNGSICEADTQSCSISNGGGTQTWNGSSWGTCYVDTCSVDYYKTNATTCGAVGTGYYSPNLDINRTACSNKDPLSYYTSDGNGSNSCSWSCNDADGDGYGTDQCSGGTDCNDSDNYMNPGQGEICDDGKDNDCDGKVDFQDTQCANPFVWVGAMSYIVPLDINGNAVGKIPGGTVVLGYGVDSSDNLYVGGYDDSVSKLSPLGSEIWTNNAFSDWTINVKYGPGGTVYAVGRDEKVKKFSSNGSLLWTYSNANLDTLSGGMAIDSSGNAYVRVSGTGIVKLSSSNGSVIQTFGSFSNNVKDIDIDSSGNIYVAVNYRAVYKFNSSGTQLWRYPTSGSISHSLTSVGVDSSNNVYFGTNGDKLKKLDSSGNLVWTCNSCSDHIKDLDVSGSNLVYCGHTDHCQRVNTSNGSIIWTFNKPSYTSQMTDVNFK